VAPISPAGAEGAAAWGNGPGSAAPLIASVADAVADADADADALAVAVALWDVVAAAGSAIGLIGSGRTSAASARGVGSASEAA
jgi:HEAT repeat protein